MSYTVEAPSKDKIIGYLGIGAGIAAGYLLSAMFVKLSDRIYSVVKGVGTNSMFGLDTASTIARLLALAIWGAFAVIGWRRWSRDDGLPNGFLFGLGIGGVVEELYDWSTGAVIGG